MHLVCYMYKTNMKNARNIIKIHWLNYRSPHRMQHIKPSKRFAGMYISFQCTKLQKNKKKMTKYPIQMLKTFKFPETFKHLLNIHLMFLFLFCSSFREYISCTEHIGLFIFIFFSLSLYRFIAIEIVICIFAHICNPFTI